MGPNPPEVSLMALMLKTVKKPQNFSVFLLLNQLSKPFIREIGMGSSGKLFVLYNTV